MSDTTCPRCGAARAPEQRFCGSCGERLSRVCGSCGSSSPPEFRFCGECGAQLGAAPSGLQAAEERRRATIVFADLSGFTALSEETDPEDLRTLVDGCLGLIGEIVERFGGTVNQVMGDGIMALFGAPVAHEDDPERAVRAALEMQQCAAEQAEAFGGLPLRVGVNTGEVMFAPLGPERRREQTVMGDPANVASRLQTSAPQGGILVGEETYHATRSAIRYEAVPALSVKGKREPLNVWLAKEAVAPPAARPLSGVPMVGRESELDLLRSVWSRVLRDDRPHIVTITGPPGIGKTRLAREFVKTVELQGARTVRGRSLPYGESTGYGAFAQQVKQIAGILETDPVTTANDKLARAARALLPPTTGEVAAQLIAARLAVLIGLSEEHAVGDRSPLLVAARTFAEAVSRQAPTVFVFEDIHWADPSLCDLIESLAATVRDAPALFLTLARPELLDTRPQWGGGLTAYTAVPLQPLSGSQALALAARLLPELPEPEKTAERLTEAAGGNPLFLEEFAASLAEGAAADRIPAGVTAIIASRIDALPPPERRLVLDASVIGKVFWRGALCRTAPDGDIDAGLAALERRDFIRREAASRLAGDEEYVFKHMLIRETAYSTLPRAARRERHASVARFIEEAAGERISEWASLLAHHWREADDASRAVDYLLMSAEAASRGWAKSEAVSQYTAALALIPLDDVDRRRAVRLRRALAMVDAADFRRAVPEIEDLLPDIQGRDLIEALLAGGAASFWLMDAGWTSDAGHRALDLAERAGAPELRAPALALVARGESMIERVAEATAIGEEALSEWTEQTHITDLAFHLGQLGTEYAWTGNYQRAVELARRGFDLAVEAQIVWAVFAGSALGMALTGVGRHDEAIDLLERVLALGREFEPVNAPRFTARTLNMYACALRELGDLDAARERNEEAIELAHRSGFLHPKIQAGTDLLYVNLAQGRIGTARGDWPVLWHDAHEELGNFYPWLVQGRLAQARADIALAAGEPETALDAAGDAIARAQRPGRVKYEILARVTAGASLHRLGKTAEAVNELRRASALARRLDHPPTRWHAASVLGEVLFATGDDAGAESSYGVARETIESFGQSLSPDRRARFFATPAIADLLAVR